MNPSASTYSSSADTREKILDAAEELFVELGFAATSLRAIATRADVNLAATNYHFGSKEGLFHAVFHRRVAPVNALRLAKLKALKESERTLTIRGILEAFFAPFRHGPMAFEPAIIGRMFAEPPSFVMPIIEDEFSEVSAEFLKALSSALPDVGYEDLQWRFHFLVGSMLQILRIPAPLGTEQTCEQFTYGIERLIDFTVAGIEQASGGADHAQGHA